jgi:hypothetical protein
VSVVFLLLIVSIISIFIPSHIRISRTIRINNTKEAVLARLTDPAEWKNWYPGADTAKFFYDAGIIKGIVLNEDLKLYLVLTSVKENEIMTAYNRTPDRKKIVSTWRIFPENNSGHITVQWYMDFNLRWYPWEKFASLLYEKSYGPQMDQGLSNLKKLLETK